MSPEPTLLALPVQIQKADDGVYVVRGPTVFKVGGQGAAEVLEALFSAIGPEGATPSSIAALFAAPHRPAILTLIDQLRARRILVPASPSSPDPTLEPEAESEQDIFYWSFGTTVKEVHNRLSEVRVAVLGVNAISERLFPALQAAGFSDTTLVDVPLLRNVRQFSGGTPPAWASAAVSEDEWNSGTVLDTGVTLVATSDYGGVEQMRAWNRRAVSAGSTFLPVLLDRFTAFVGPLVVPGGTPCYACLLARENSNLDNPAASRATEAGAFHGQFVNGFLPSMASIAADVGVVELLRFHCRALPYKVGALIEIKMLMASMTARPLLKVPHCPVCSPLRLHPAVNLNRYDFVPGGQLQSSAS